MVKISTRGRYCLRFLIDLAEHTGEYVSLSAAAERQNISLRYLEQLAVVLRRAGFIRSIKGAAGGYTLAKEAEKIIAADVLRTVEGDILAADPAGPDKTENKAQRCIRFMVLDKLNAAIAEVLENRTLAAIAGTSREAYDYYI